MLPGSWCVQQRCSLHHSHASDNRHHASVTLDHHQQYIPSLCNITLPSFSRSSVGWLVRVAALLTASRPGPAARQLVPRHVSSSCVAQHKKHNAPSTFCVPAKHDTARNETGSVCKAAQSLCLQDPSAVQTKQSAAFSRHHSTSSLRLYCEKQILTSMASAFSSSSFHIRRQIKSEIRSNTYNDAHLHGQRLFLHQLRLGDAHLLAAALVDLQALNDLRPGQEWRMIQGTSC